MLVDPCRRFSDDTLEDGIGPSGISRRWCPTIISLAGFALEDVFFSLDFFGTSLFLCRCVPVGNRGKRGSYLMRLFG